MGFMDKLKVQADQLSQKAQQGVAQGQAKIGDLQAKRQADALLRDLGAAVYAAQRHGGPHEPIEQAMTALDAHVAQNGAIDTKAAAGSGAPGTVPPPPPTTGGTSSDFGGGSPGFDKPAGFGTPSAPPGDFRSDDR